MRQNQGVDFSTEPQILDLQRDALLEAEVLSEHLYDHVWCLTEPMNSQWNTIEQEQCLRQF
ncbi:hypothetical protein BJAS_P3892 [Bathymodiolus japonicus methanotrophic gill symbiont]|nr:hypothetical protein BJAS_P3892 [Bathymodiolus japonicus methanotrophic gill symbiont]